jgi:ankyrin repeat protein
MDRLYEYSPLDLGERSFRLLRLIMGNKWPIQCEIIHARFDDTEDIIPYDALSYTWGDQSNLQKIEVHRTTPHVDRTVLPVTENLHAALQRLRHRDNDRILWIDAICIDQNNPVERGHQVKQMSSIYEKAVKVIFWLGKSTLVTQMAFDYMCKLQKEALGHACKTWTISDERWQPLRRRIEPPLSNTHKSRDEFLREGFRDLLARTWFRRAWIIQEVAQARRAEVMCGAQSIPVRTFAVTVSSLGMEIEHHCQAILDIMPGTSRETSWWAGQRDLRTLLHKFRKSKRSDARDAIYSLLGISSDKNAEKFPTPDYYKSEHDLILQTLKHFVNFNGFVVDGNDLPWWRMDHFLDDIPWLESELFKRMIVLKRMDVPKMLLDTYQVNINSEDRHGSTLLEWATREKREKAVKLLQGSGEGELEVKSETTHEATVPQQLDTEDIEAEYTYKDRLVPQSLLWAAQTGDEATSRQLLSTDDIDVTINRPDRNGSTPLSWAARNGHTAIVQLLLNTGKVDVNLEDRNGSTPLMWAARNGHNKTIWLLLNTSKANAKLCDRTRSTPFLWAARNGHTTVVELLLNTDKIDVSLEDQNRSTPLLWAARNGHNTVVQLLLDTEGINVNLDDRNGSTPLSWAARFGHDTVVQSLLDTEEIDVSLEDQNRSTPLHWAARFGHNTTFQLLLQTGRIDVNLKGPNGSTPLLWAARFGHDTVVRSLILTYGRTIGVNLEDQEGLTPLHWAARNGNNTIIELLLGTDKIDADLKDQNGSTPLLWATRNGHYTVVQLLMLKYRRMISVNREDREGLTPLHWAARNGNNTIIRLLMLATDIDIHRNDQDGLSPMSWAKREGHTKTVDLLFQYGVPVIGERVWEPLARAIRIKFKAVFKLFRDTDKGVVRPGQSRHI